MAAFEAREHADDWLGPPEPMPLPRWQLSIVFGPCSGEEAHELHDDVLARIGSQYGASYGLEEIDARGREDA
jgi:hypothetical protein